ncbi:1801_t:CDS:1, partial [Scutellospora calospora]
LSELLSNNITAILTPNYDYIVSEQSLVLDIIEPSYNANNILKPLKLLPNNVVAVLSPNYDYV